MPNRAKPAPNTLPAAQPSDEAEPRAQQSASPVQAFEAARSSDRARPEPHRPADILGLQQAVGNRAVQRLLHLQRPQQHDRDLAAPLQREVEPKPEGSKTTGAELAQLAGLIAQHKAQLLATWGKAGSGQRITEEQIDVVIAGLRMTAVSDDPKAQEAVLREINASQSSQTAGKAADPQAAGLQRSPVASAGWPHGVLQRDGDDDEPVINIPVERLYALFMLILLLFALFAHSQVARRQRAAPAPAADGGAQGAEALVAVEADADAQDAEADEAQDAGAAPAGQGARRRRRRNGGGQPAAPAVVYNVGAVIAQNDVGRVQAALNAENRARRDAYRAARIAVNQHRLQQRAYDHDRSEASIPNNIGGSVQANVDEASQRAYGNAQNYFPQAGEPYQEYNINPGAGAVGNFRKIEPAQPVNNFSYWVGWNITHPGNHWIRVWNTALNRWQDWDGGTRTSADLAGHVVNAPAAPPAAQVQLAQQGYIEKYLKMDGYQIKVDSRQRQE